MALSANQIDFQPVQPASAIKPAFARHDTFHPRWGWLRKGFDAAVADPAIFGRPDAHLRLGVGKNMVRAIRYWCHATGLLVGSAEGVDAGHASPSPFGERLLAEAGGLDPYLEHPGSWWWLHWQLARRPEWATAWDFAFSRFARRTFTQEDLTRALRQYVDRVFPDARVADSSLQKDASCIVRMYASPTGETRLAEESIHCPFAELGLVRPAADTGAYSFAFGAKPGLPSPMVAAACLEFATSHTAARAIAFSRLLHEPGSPGMVFKLTESAMYAYLEPLAGRGSPLSLHDVAGVLQLSFDGESAILASDLWESAYPALAAPEVAA
jgi:Protein of unknown function (DUF4007)